MSINTELQIFIIINNSSSLNHTYMRISALYKLVCREDILITPSCMKTSDGAWKTKMVECQTNIICWKGPENWRKLHFFHMVIRVFIQKRSNTWSRLIKTQYVFGRSPTKNCVTSRIMIEKASNHIETVKLSLRNDCILAFLCLNGKKHLGLMLCLYISNKFQVLKYFVYTKLWHVSSNCKGRPRIGAFLYKNSNDHGFSCFLVET